MVVCIPVLVPQLESLLLEIWSAAGGAVLGLELTFGGRPDIDLREEVLKTERMPRKRDGGGTTVGLDVLSGLSIEN